LVAGVRVKLGFFSKWFHPELAIDPQALWLGRPVLVMTMTSFSGNVLVKLAEVFGGGRVPQGVEIKNGKVALDLLKLMPPGEARALLSHLKQLEVNSDEGVLLVRFAMEIT
jgi:hypothetical protein